MEQVVTQVYPARNLVPVEEQLQKHFVAFSPQQLCVSFQTGCPFPVSCGGACSPFPV